MRIVGVIPARYHSSRLPGKPIVDICGKPMIWWVYQQLIKESHLDDVVVATDDKRIVDVCKEYRIKALMTSLKHETPTARIHEVSQIIAGDLYLVVMGDEPLIDARCFSLIIPQKETPKLYVAALTNEIDSPTEVIDFSNQKVVTNEDRETLMISRSPIPYPKGTLDFVYEKVTGVQIFSKQALDFYSVTKKTKIEFAEENDLMRFVEHGICVKMIKSPYKTVSVDTKKDLEFVIDKIKEINKHEI